MADDAAAETGGPNRTPRSEIRPAVSANRTREPVLLLDLSTRKNLARDKFGKARAAVVSFDAVTDPGEIALDLITLVS